MSSKRFYYICSRCGKLRLAHYKGKRVCLSCNILNKNSKRSASFFGSLFSVFKFCKK